LPNKCIDVKDMDAIVLAVPHDNFKNLDEKTINSFFKNVPNENKVIIDIKSMLNKDLYEGMKYNYFRL